MSKKVQVRIAVAFDVEGAAHCIMLQDYPESASDAFTDLHYGGYFQNRAILTAELDVPEVQEVAASVERSE